MARSTSDPFNPAHSKSPADFEEAYRSMFERMPYPMWVYDLESLGFVEVNEAAITHYGYSREEFLSMSIRDIRPPEDVLAMQTFATAPAQGLGVAQSFRHIKKDGTLIHVLISLHSITIEGRAARLVLVNDISERVTAEEALRESELKYRTLFDSIDQGFVIAEVLFDEDDRAVDLLYLEANAEARRMLGTQELAGRRLLEIDAGFESYWFEIFEHVLHTGRGERLERYAAPLNAWYDFYVLRMGGEDSRRIAILFQDVTERRLAEQALKHAKEEAEAANRAKSEFLSRTSHELRTPLNAILGFGQILEMDLEKEENRESLEQILRAGRHLLTLVDEVLDLSNIETGELRLNPEDVLLEEEVRGATELIRPLAEQRGIVLQTRHGLEPDLTVRCDAPRLRQVLLNLLSNAIKFSLEGGNVYVTSGLASDDRVCITVRDTGLGIAEEHRPKIFTPFFRGGAEKHGIPGTGLGLSLSKGLVEAMGGTLSFESREGAGSTFTVELPRGEKLTGKQVNGTNGTARPPATGMRTVLYIEDNVPNQQLIERVLQRRQGIQLISAMQGGMGLELARQHCPDLLLLDLDLPDIPGEEVMRQLQADTELSELPVVIITADATEPVRKRLLGKGAIGYLTKPLDVSRFLQVLDDILGDR